MSKKNEKGMHDPTDSFQDDAINRKMREDAERSRKRNRVSFWLVLGVGLAILLLLIWLTIADFWGDTDVAADFITPLLLK